MKVGFPKMLFRLSFLCILFFHGYNGTQVDTVGKGQCYTDYDCSNNGICEAKDNAQDGECLCMNGYIGKNCEKKSKSKVEGEEVKPENESNEISEVKESSGSRRSKLGQLARRSDVLEFDKESNVVGLEPNVLADQEQPFLIYSPREKKYLYMSRDIVVFGGKHNTHLEARSDRGGKRNLFVLKKAGGMKYHLYNVETRKYVYVSKSTTGVFKWESNNVLGAEGAPQTQNHPEKFEFEFEGNNDGLYKIKNNDKYLFIATFRAGIPMHNIIEADDKDRTRDQTQLFQLVLKEKAVVSVEYKKDEMVVDKASDIDCAQHKFENSNKDAKDLTSAVNFERTFTSTSTHSKTVGYTVTGSFTAGVTIAEILKLGATITGSRQSTDQTTDTKTTTEKISQTFTIVTPGGKLSCVVILTDRASYKIPFVMTARTKENKKLIATGSYYGNRHVNTRVKQDVYDWESGKKCPFEEIF